MPNKFILTLDSSQISTFMECPTKWFLQYRKSLIPNKAKRSTTPMDMGTYGHKLLEIMYKERAKGNEKGAIDVALAFDIDKETCRCAHSSEYHGYKIITREQIPELDCISQETSGKCTATGCTCQEFDPKGFPLDALERESVRNRFLDYTMFEGTVIPELIPPSPDHVEVGFSKKIYEDELYLFILEGRIDLIGQIAPNVERGWADHKWQARKSQLYTKTIQFRNYSLVMEMPIGVINYVRLADKLDKETFQRAVLSFSRQEMNWWSDQLISTFFNVAKAIQTMSVDGTNEDHWYEPDDEFRDRSACPGKYGYFCDYTQICENAFMGPELIKIDLAENYTKRPEWRPW